MTTKKRKVIQITAATESDGSARYAQVFLLCDDGTVWVRYHGYGSGSDRAWTRLPDLPQGTGK
jgi:hypothetical protein